MNTPENIIQDAAIEYSKGYAVDFSAVAREVLAARPDGVAVPAFTGIGRRKLDELLTRGYRITGYSFEWPHDDDGRSPTRGFITHGGLVGWWSPENDRQELATEPGAATTPEDEKQACEKAMAALDTMTELWAAQINLRAMVKPMIAVPAQHLEDQMMKLAKMAHSEGRFAGYTAADARVVELKEEIAECDQLREKLAGILSRTAVALKGPEAPLTRHSWHDLEACALALVAERGKLFDDMGTLEVRAAGLEHLLRRAKVINSDLTVERNTPKARLEALGAAPVVKESLATEPVAHAGFDRREPCSPAELVGAGGKGGAA